MVKRTFDPGFRVELHQKDLSLALSTARKIGLSLPNTATAQELFNSCVAHGGSKWDHSGMVRRLNSWPVLKLGSHLRRNGGLMRGKDAGCPLRGGMQ